MPSIHHSKNPNKECLLVFLSQRRLPSCEGDAMQKCSKIKSTLCSAFHLLTCLLAAHLVTSNVVMFIPLYPLGMPSSEYKRFIKIN